MDNTQLDEIFTYHAPKGDQQERYVSIYVSIREQAKALAYHLNANCPESREKSIALTKLQECVQMANAAIAINE